VFTNLTLVKVLEKLTDPYPKSNAISFILVSSYSASSSTSAKVTEEVPARTVFSKLSSVSTSF